MLKVILIIFSLSLLNTSTRQSIENGLYISYKGGFIPKYAILTIEQDSSKLEVFTKWQGEWLPAIGDWDNSYQPQILIKNENGTLSNENVIIQNKKGIMGLVKNSFAGRMKFKFNKVETLPENYKEIRLKGIEFTRRKG
jgi:hypothetical protein